MITIDQYHNYPLWQKPLKKGVNIQLTNNLELNKLFYEQQYGFKKREF
jgi:hypothetical protein